jgi:expansin (peptidoglycan-binding protein)
MAHRPSGPGRIPRRRLTGRAGLTSRAGRAGGRRLAGFRVGTVAAASAGVVVVLVALAVGISQATAAPACASVIMPGTGAGVTAAAAVTAAGAQTSGEATHYELASGGMGNCSYPSPPAGQLYVALPPSEYGAAAACGSYLQVSGPDGSVTVEVVDQCPECQAGHIDLSEQAFAKIAPLSAGLVPVTYRTIADPPLPAPLSMLVKAGSSAYYLALLPINNGNPLATVAVSQGAGGWQELSRTTYGYWLASSGAGPGPFSVRLTDSLGHQATVHGITISPGVIQSTGTSMYGAAAASPAASAAPAKKAAHARRARHRHRHRHHAPHATASPALAGGISVAEASSPPVAASPTPSCD